jgi:hypothetical protein
VKKYCSVYNSLRKDMTVNIKYILEDRELSRNVGTWALMNRYVPQRKKDTAISLKRYEWCSKPW